MQQTTEHHTHNGPPDPTPRRDKLTPQEVPGAGGPHHAPATKHTTSPPLQQQCHRRKHQRKTTSAGQRPGTPPTHSPTPEAPQHASRTHSRTTFPGAPSRPASPSTKVQPHPNHRRTLPAQDVPVAAKYLVI
ncbi:hypothetical protein ATANTOWER_015360 [Ataeniobius toweri]|uniref:Uncharacterized protein n=1 Tax=Ataeniobius toweri TaxID=208326 RepID=A0ABU7BQF2_9TELE|nr:hypothetical protein [Ataeniobius toweri]